MNDGMKIKELVQLYGVSKATIYRWTRENPDFPKSYKLGPRSSRWSRKAIESHFSTCRKTGAPA